MRLLVLVAAGLLGLVGRSDTPASTQPAKTAKPVRINVTCQGDGVDFSIDNWTVHLKQNATTHEDVEWRLNGNANTATVTIEPKNAADWPYTDPPPYVVTKTNPKRLSGVKPNVPKGHAFAYNIRAVCQAGTGPRHNVVIDPDIVVDE